MNICNLIRHIQQKQHLHQVIDKVLTIYVWNRRYFESHSGTQTHTHTKSATEMVKQSVWIAQQIGQSGRALKTMLTFRKQTNHIKDNTSKKSDS